MGTGLPFPAVNVTTWWVLIRIKTDSGVNLNQKKYLYFSALRHKACFKDLVINFILRKCQNYFIKEIAVQYNRSKLYTVVFTISLT